MDFVSQRQSLTAELAPPDYMWREFSVCTVVKTRGCVQSPQLTGRCHKLQLISATC